MKQYINNGTGEVVTRKTWIGAYLYFKADGRRYCYKVRLQDIRREK